MRVFENRVLRRIFRPKRDEVTGEWRKLHSDNLCTYKEQIPCRSQKILPTISHICGISWCVVGDLCEKNKWKGKPNESLNSMVKILKTLH
jgi:hypothetical protein